MTRKHCWLALLQRPLVWLTAVAAGIFAAAPSEASPYFAAGGLEADGYGAAQGHPVAAIVCPRFMVGLFSPLDQVWDARKVLGAAEPSALKRATPEPAIRCEYELQTRTIGDCLARNPVTWLLVVQVDTILVDRQPYNRSDTHRLASFSMVKTMLSTMVGIAIGDRAIRSIDALVADCAPALPGAEYGRSSIRRLLQMTSGVRFDENRGADLLWNVTVSAMAAPEERRPSGHSTTGAPCSPSEWPSARPSSSIRPAAWRWSRPQ